MHRAGEVLGRGVSASAGRRRDGARRCELLPNAEKSPTWGRAYLPRRLCVLCARARTGNPRRVDPSLLVLPRPASGVESVAHAPPPSVPSLGNPRDNSLVARELSAADPALRPEGSTLAPLSSRADGPARTLTRRGDAAVAVPRNVAPSTATRDTLSACSNAMYRGFFRASSRDTHSAPTRAPSRVHASGLGEN